MCNTDNDALAWQEINYDYRKSFSSTEMWGQWVSSYNIPLDVLYSLGNFSNDHSKQSLALVLTTTKNSKNQTNQCKKPINHLQTHKPNHNTIHTLALDCHRIQWPSMTLNAKIRVLWIFWRFRAATEIYIIHKVAPHNYRYAIQTEDLVLVY